jgi:hypothetical protein
MAACTRDKGCTYLTPSKERPEPVPEGAGPVRMGRPAWALLGSISAQFAPRSIFCTLDYCPL